MAMFLMLTMVQALSLPAFYVILLLVWQLQLSRLTGTDTARRPEESSVGGDITRFAVFSLSIILLDVLMMTQMSLTLSATIFFSSLSAELSSALMTSVCLVLTSGSQMLPIQRLTNVIRNNSSWRKCISLPHNFHLFQGFSLLTSCHHYVFFFPACVPGLLCHCQEALVC